ncbi:6-phosphogluconolactonase, cycloisomerase 2 family [Anaerosphaera aminiphila DSM 21120]|uniref:6-phosphogluconolactonase, cycloisomerase 2 family n=1 Tax=Anaerosphaera aminiphila DSM 21120 TaxID=1120995 RepID=A0A1M5TBT7_9FIRM|nr:beta-propeller fold lactonase family protein [Anaerosphaera aminiphila]SHH48202.1 6-phosphogluconolactonase, cycloisomerase 2 family [Anaerosphaera aminiphila DSM 21120]
MKIAYVGSRTTKKRNARGKGLKVYQIDDITNNWTEIQCLYNIDNPSYQTLDNNNEYLYSVHGDLTTISSYKILSDGKLENLNQIDIKSKNPVFLTVDKKNNYLVVATLQGGSLHSIKLNSDGTLGEISDKYTFPGKEENSISYAHQCIWDKTKNYLFVPTQARDQGYSALNVVKFNSDNGTFTLTDTFYAREHSEPRHISVHNNNKFLYLINEKGNMMTYLEFDEINGKVSALQNLPTLPETYTGNGQASASILSVDNLYLIGSNRIHESLVIYKINQNTGYMKEIGYESCLGKTPRFITFNSEGDKLYVANEDSDTIIEYLFQNGRLTFSGRIINTESPVCITFI